jgi:hypothetical protein
MAFDRELSRDFQRIDYRRIPDYLLLLCSIKLWPKRRHNANLYILCYVVPSKLHGYPSLITVRYSEFLRRFRCKMYIWHKRWLAMGISSRCSVAAATRGAGV